MREWIVIGALVGVLCASLAWSEEIKYRWSLVRKGGKEVNNTRATGTNDAAWFAGNWWGHKDPTNPGGAFRFQKGKFIPFTCPNIPEATKIEVADIESSSTIVGHLWVPNGQGGETLHAFLYKHGLATCDVIDVPGAFWTFLFRVNANRQVAVGYFYTDGQGTFWGAGVYDWATKQVTPVTIDGAADLVIRGINNHGELVGSYTLLDPTDPCLCMFWDNGFYRSADGQIVHLTTPNGGPIFPHAINDHGVVVGETWWATGFRWDLNTGEFQDIPHPSRQDGFRTYIADIDNQGRMAAVNERHADGYTESWWLRPIE